MSYELTDFEESVTIAEMRLGLEGLAKKIERVDYAWGESIGEWGEWSGGFICKLEDGPWGQLRYIYISGWCDTSGWGCQDGVEVTFFGNYRVAPSDIDSRLDPEDARERDWDEMPEDLNRLIKEWQKELSE